MWRVFLPQSLVSLRVSAERIVVRRWTRRDEFTKSLAVIPGVRSDVARWKTEPRGKQMSGDLFDAVRMAFAQPRQESDAVRLAIREAST